MFGIVRGMKGAWSGLSRLGSHTKGVMVIGGGGYAGWHKFSTGKWPLQDTGGKAADLVNNGLDTANRVVNGVNKAIDKVGDVADAAPDMIKDTKDVLTGGGDGQGGSFLSRIFGGLGNMVSGLFNGGTGTILGLVASAFLLFGNFGWLGKIAGGLLGAMSLGMFGGSSQQQAQQQAVPAAARRQDVGAGVPYPQYEEPEDEERLNYIHRSR